MPKITEAVYQAAQYAAFHAAESDPNIPPGQFQVEVFALEHHSAGDDQALAVAVYGGRYRLGRVFRRADGRMACGYISASLPVGNC